MFPRISSADEKAFCFTHLIPLVFEEVILYSNIIKTPDRFLERWSIYKKREGKGKALSVYSNKREVNIS
jgi:hypothetical protein